MDLAAARASGRRGDILFAALWLFVGATSAVDACLMVRYAGAVREENPFAQRLIITRPHSKWLVGPSQDVSLLIAVKMFGTLVALGLLLVLYQKWRRGARLAIAGLAVFQVLLLFCLFG
jgi:hypothetical protein